MGRLEAFRPGAAYHLVQATRGLSYGVIVPYMVVYFRGLGLSLLQIGLIGSLFEGAILLAEVPTGVLADRWGHLRSVVLGLLIAGGAGLLYSGGRLEFLIAAAVLHGLGEAFLSGSAEAWAIGISGPGVGADPESMLARGLQARSAGLLLGMALAAVFLSHRLTVAWWIFASLHLTLGAVLCRWGRGLGSRIVAGRDQPVCASGSRRAVLLQWNHILLLIIAVSLGAEFGYAVVDEFWQVFLCEDLALGLAWFPLVTVGGTLLCLVGADTAVVLLRRRVGVFQSFLWLQVTLAAGICALAAARQPWLAIGVLIGLSFVHKLYAPLANGWLGRLSAESRRATVISCNSLAGALGEVGAGVAGGAVAQVFGLRQAFVLGAGAFLLGCLAIHCTRRLVAQPSSVRPAAM